MKEGKFYVYTHINKSNGKIYIGKTSNPNSKDLLAELNNMYKVKPGLFINRPNSITHYLNTQM